MKIRLQTLVLMIVTTMLLTSCNTAATITAEQAQNIALQDANVTADTVKYLSALPDRDNGRLYYDVSFWNDGTEYEYEIDAATGEIVSVDVDATP